MDIHVYDTWITTQQGQRLHFDVLTAQKDNQAALGYAHQWLQQQGINAEDIEHQLCRFCHIEAANPSVTTSIREKGYAVILLA